MEEEIKVTLDDMEEEGNQKFLRLLDPLTWDRIRSQAKDAKDDDELREIIGYAIEGKL